MSVERHAAAETLLVAYRELQNYYSFQNLFGLIREDIADGELSFDYNISDQLGSFVKRLKEFALAIDGFQDEMEDRFEDAAWDYLALEYGLNRGDRVQHVENGKTETVTLEHLYMNEPDPKDLTAEGHVLRKRGSVGRRHARVRFGYDDWTRIPFPEATE